jgi:hypothetical protein
MDSDAGEREQRHDHEARPGVEAILEPFVARDRGRHAELCRPGELGCGLLAKGARQLRYALQVRTRGRIRAHRESDRQPGEQRVDARLVERHPNAHPEEHRGRPPPGNRGVAQRQQQAEEAGRDNEGKDVDMVRVDRCDHEQRHEVVDHHQGQQTNPQARGTRSHQRKHP